MRRFVLPLLLISMFILVACSTKTAVPEQTASQPAPVSDAAPTQTNELTRTDEQGAIVFVITPLNLGTPADTLEFDVSMNTHSVDLSMDLAQLATLSTDAGLTVQASKWDATPGGHHVSGKLIFPSIQDTKSILEGASKLTLTIINVDATSRIFEWELK